ncbi:feruloyl esterase [Aspergillus stella-maris]|uniref:feruloyl esterase n=1 Tax=Aspergillus stella-maris TaxID=1810926 RepID=UPI003CCCE601
MNVTACSPSAIPTPAIYGADILSLTAAWTTNFTLDVPVDFNYNHGAAHLVDTHFCNITVTYTHPGYGDRITVETWLPRDWNGRLQATGGGGWNAGRFVLSDYFMAGALAEGYATTTTDAGLLRLGDGDGDGDGDSSPRDWALTSPGNVDIVSLQNLGARSLNDQALIGKALVRGFYRRGDPEYSYFSGCSHGGRQGLMLAQRYPDAYDGIAAAAPAQSWTKLLSGAFYPQLMREWHGVDPLACELDFLTREVVAACDAADEVQDGLISDMAACEYSPYSSVNKTFVCESLNNRTITLSRGAAIIAEAAWDGPRTREGERLWFGVNPGTNISSFGSSAPGQNNTSSSTGVAGIADPWFGLFVAKDPAFDATSMTFDEYIEYFRRAVREFSGLIDAADPDLRAFRDRGGKLISYHGMADPSIPTKATEHYYDSVRALSPGAHDFYRFFESPGLGHCSGGRGGQPTTVFDALTRWVENGTAPDSLPVEYPAADGNDMAQKRIICPYPQRAEYVGGDVASSDSFRCI